jgi:ubiquinone/menaquinone biosynthesis C-methylase UbiE
MSEPTSSNETHSHSHSHSHHAGSALAGIIPGLELPGASRRALDVGCGTGDDVRWLAEAGFDAIGIDVSETALALAAERTPPELDVTWIHGSATALPAEDASLSLVHDHGCLHHLSRADRPAYAREVARVLTPGGAWVIRDLLGHGGPHVELDETEVDALAQGASLRIESRDVADVPHGTHQALVVVLRRSGRGRGAA